MGGKREGKEWTDERKERVDKAGVLAKEGLERRERRWPSELLWIISEGHGTGGSDVVVLQVNIVQADRELDWEEQY